MSPPESVIDDALRLTRLARQAVDDAEAEGHRTRRDKLLAAHDFRAHVRTDGSETAVECGEILVCYPADWEVDGSVDPARIDDISRAVERPLDATPGADDWESVERHNRVLAEQVAEEYGATHGANAHAFADFMGNHYARRMDQARPTHVEEFLAEYFPRNAWPSAEQRDTITETVSLIVED